MQRARGGRRGVCHLLDDKGLIPGEEEAGGALAVGGKEAQGGGMAKAILTAKEIEAALATLPEWRFERDALAKEFEFGGFREALSFMVRAGFDAEDLNHHPEWTNVYNKVAVRLNTHDAGGKVTAKDVELATRFERISWV